MRAVYTVQLLRANGSIFSTNAITGILSTMARCRHGPYVFSTLTDTHGGIGVAFIRRSLSLALAYSLNATWVGTLVNEHTPETDVQSMMGIGSNDCSPVDLQGLKTTTSSCADPCACTMDNLSSQTVIKVDSENGKGYPLPSVVWSCAWNNKLRKDILDRAFARGVRRKPSSTTWACIHFRWGDVATHSINSPNVNVRTVKPFSAYLQNVNRFRRDELLVFSEGRKSEFVHTLAGQGAQLFINSTAWVDHIALMAQCDVLVGGHSTFFEFAAAINTGKVIRIKK